MKTMSKSIEFCGVELDIEFTISPPYRGLRDSLNGIPGAGAPLEPDEDAYIEIDKILCGEQDIFELLFDTQIEKIKEILCVELSESEDDYDYREEDSHTP